MRRLVESENVYTPLVATTSQDSNVLALFFFLVVFVSHLTDAAYMHTT